MDVAKRLIAVECGFQISIMYAFSKTSTDINFDLRPTESESKFCSFEIECGRFIDEPLRLSIRAEIALIIDGKVN